MSEKHEFQAEVSRLLDIVANALYTDKEIFLRELISNASDACDRMRYEAISNTDLKSDDLKINLSFDTDARTLTVSDNGIGMDKDELVKNLGTIAHSGTREMLKNFDGDNKKDVNLIGQFGVGFYSAFMVSDKIEVLTLKAGNDKAYRWNSDGKGSYSVEEHLKDEVGTEITLHLKDEASEYLLEERLKHIIKKYSDHVSFPIVLSGETVNKASALWTRSKSEITEDEYSEFYKHVSGDMVMDEPWATLHWKAEGAFEYSNLLFIPTMKPFDLYDPARHHGVKLFVKRVFITEGVEGLIPPFLRFMKGVVDSEDLPLNISREMLQNNPMVKKMSGTIVKKVLAELKKKAENEPEKFEEFWSIFGSVVKEGLYDAHSYRDSLCDVVRFYSTKVEGLTSLSDYVSRMKDGQENIYYISGGELESAKNSPQLEAFRDKDIEVLFMTDSIDEFWLPIQGDFKEKKFKSITRGSAELSKICSNKNKKDDKSDYEGKEETKSEDMEALITRMKEILSGEVKDVCLSERLVESPVCLIASESDVDINMQKILSKNPGYDDQHQRILEINENHPIILKLKNMVGNDSSAQALQDTTLLLLDQARIVEGQPLKNPIAFVRRMSKAVEQGLLAG